MVDLWNNTKHAAPPLQHCLRHLAIFCILLVALAMSFLHVSTNELHQLDTQQKVQPKLNFSEDGIISLKAAEKKKEPMKSLGIDAASDEQFNAEVQKEEEEKEEEKEEETIKKESHILPDDHSSEMTEFTTIQGLKTGQEYPVKKSSVEQIERYRGGDFTGVMLMVHIENNAGHYFCDFIKQSEHPAPGVTPNFVCRGVTPGDHLDPDDYKSWGLILPKHRTPWLPGEDTDINILRVRKYFHMVAQLYGEPPTATIPLADAQWEHPDLLSVLLMRDPIERILAGVHSQQDINENITLASKLKTKDAIWEFANGEATDNPVLRILAGQECCSGADTDRKHLEASKKLLQRISIVIDMACLDQSLEVAKDLFNYNLSQKGEKTRLKAETLHRERPLPRERIGDDEVYDYLLKRNRLEIELYEWSKTISLVKNC